VSAENSVERAEELLDRLEATRVKLEATDDPEQAIEVLGELAELARAIETEIQQAKREADEEVAGEDS
jgi:hypothetical protein